MNEVEKKQPDEMSISAMIGEELNCCRNKCNNLIEAVASGGEQFCLDQIRKTRQYAEENGRHDKLEQIDQRIKEREAFSNDIKLAMKIVGISQGDASELQRILKNRESEVGINQLTYADLNFVHDMVEKIYKVYVFLRGDNYQGIAYTHGKVWQ